MNLSGKNSFGFSQYFGSFPIIFACTNTIVLAGISYPSILQLSKVSLGTSNGTGGCSLKLSFKTNFRYMSSDRSLSFTFCFPFKTSLTSSCAFLNAQGSESIQPLSIPVWLRKYQSPQKTCPARKDFTIIIRLPSQLN